MPTQHFQEFVVIGNLRAEPTTEYIKEKQIYDQQPYTCGDWSIVHNGTIANDKELRTYELPTKIDSAAIAEILKGTEACFSSFSETVSKLKGSYAIIATNSKQKDTLYVATNYKPIWFISTDFGYFFASSKEYLPQNWAAEMVAPYSISISLQDLHSLRKLADGLLLFAVGVSIALFLLLLLSANSVIP